MDTGGLLPTSSAFVRRWGWSLLVGTRCLCGGQVNELKSSIKFQLKKVLCMGVAIGNVGMEEKEIYVNTQARLPRRALFVSSTLFLRGMAP